MEPNTGEKSAREHTPVVAGAVHHGRQHRVAAQEDDQPAAQTFLVLPINVISRSEISKCVRELENLKDFFHQAGIRGAKDQGLPSLGRSLESIAEANKLNLLHDKDRDQLKSFLTSLKAKAPVIHMSFSSEASDLFLGKLLEWFRKEVHPHVLLEVGLQPELAAGCTVRTTNKFFDFSFRRRFESSKDKLVLAIKALDQAPVTLTAETTPPTTNVEASTAVNDPAVASTIEGVGL